MAIQLLPQQRTLGGGLGTGLGSGISSGIDALVNMKLENLKQNQKIKQTEQSLLQLGLPQKEAATYAILGANNPQLLNTIVKEGIQAPSQRLFEDIITGKQQAPQEAQGPASGLEALRGPETPQVAQEQAMQPIERPIVKKPVAPKKAKDEITIIPSKKPDAATKLSNDIDRMKRAISSGKLKPKHTSELSKLITKKEDTLSKLVISEKKEKTTQDRFEKKQKLDEKKFELSSKKHLDGMTLKQQRNELEEQKRLDKKYDEYMNKSGNKAEAALVDKARFAEMERINNKGDLGSNGFNIVVDALKHGLFGLGINLTSLQTADAQAMDKLSKDFVKNIKDIIGTSRITQAEIMLYLSTIPNLMQSAEGRDRIIKTNQIFNELPIIKYKIQNDILEKNNGNYTKNFKGDVFKKMEPHLRKLESQIKRGAKEAKKREAERKPTNMGKEVKKAFDQLSISKEEAAAVKDPETLLGLEKARPFLRHFFPNI